MSIGNEAYLKDCRKRLRVLLMTAKLRGETVTLDGEEVTEEDIYECKQATRLLKQVEELVWGKTR